MEKSLSLILFVATVTLYTGAVGLFIGMLARSAKIALGCAVSLATVGLGVALAAVIWSVVR